MTPAPQTPATTQAPEPSGEDATALISPAPAPAPDAEAQRGGAISPRWPASPHWRPALEWLALTPVLALSAVLNTHRLSQNGYANVFYSAAVKSMLGSFHNFVFASFDPGGLITVDKPPLALWVQAVSAKLFGFSPLSLLLPEAIIGVLGVAALYGAMRRPFGWPAALGSALALAVFPSYVAVSRDNGVDPILILLMILACGAALRAIRNGHWLPLLTSAVLVGLAFNAKTLAAVPVIPGIALGYLLCAPGPLRRRLLKLVAAGALMAAVSVAWIVYVEATPASQRPYVGGSIDNTEYDLTFGYNGFGRVEGQVGGPGEIFVRLGAVAPFPARVHTRLTHKKTAAPRVVPNPILPDGHYTNPTPFGGAIGPLRLLHYGLGGQGGWMLPFALFGFVVLALNALWPPRATATDSDPPSPPSPPAPPAPTEFSSPPAEPSPPPAERSPPAPAESPQAAPAESSQPAQAEPSPPAAESKSRFERLRRDGPTAGLLVFGVWFLAEAFLLDFSKGIVHPYYVSALAPGAAAMIGAGAVAFAQVARRRDRRVILLPLAVAATIAAQLVLLHREHYAHWLPPLLIAGSAAGVVALLAVRRLAAPAMALVLGVLLIAPTAFSTTTWSIPVEGTFPAAGTRVAGGLGPYGITHHNVLVDRALMRYIDARHPTRRWAVLTVSSNTSASLILLGWRAGALGGYSGTDPALDGRGLARLVARREARYVVLGGAYSSRGGNLATAAVVRACHHIPSQVWLGAPRYSIYSLALYDCAGRERQLAGT
jgi:4-amino-4-deoxy-L-arabinose transferase-like glycosyltransferase